jgi:hypothetical protein
LGEHVRSDGPHGGTNQANPAAEVGVQLGLPHGRTRDVDDPREGLEGHGETESHRREGQAAVLAPVGPACGVQQRDREADTQVRGERQQAVRLLPAEYGFLAFWRRPVKEHRDVEMTSPATVT